MKSQSLIASLGLILVATALHFDRGTAFGENAAASPERREPLVPDHRSKRRDYDIEHYKLKQDDLLRINTRGTYGVVRVEDRHLLLKPLPNQEGLLPDTWKIPAGRSHIGNHHKIVVSDLNVKEQTATVLLEYKERWHWWDINF